MPVRSRKQWNWLAQNKPDLLSKWQKEAPRRFALLPNKKPSPGIKIMKARSNSV